MNLIIATNQIHARTKFNRAKELYFRENATAYSAVRALRLVHKYARIIEMNNMEKIKQPIKVTPNYFNG